MSLDEKDLVIIENIVEKVVQKSQEELAATINESFKYVEKRFDDHDKQLAELRKEQIEQSILLHRIDHRTHDQQKQLDDHEHKLRMA